MSYVSLLKNIPEFLSQPTGIAAVASLGIHGAIALLLPIVPMDSKPKQETSSKSSVGLVELSQAEQSRLPQPGVPQPSLQSQASVLPQVPPPNFASSPNFANPSTPSLPPLPPPTASTDLILPPIPKTNDVAVASLPKSQPLPILSTRDLQPESSLRSPKIKSLPPFPQKVKLGESKPLGPSGIPYNVPAIQGANIPQEQELINNSIPASSTPMPVAPAQGNLATQTSGPVGEVPQGISNQQFVSPGAQPPVPGQSAIALNRQDFSALPQSNSFKAPELPPLATERSISKPKTFAERFTEAKKQYPNLETRQLIAAIVDAKAGQGGDVEGDLVINGQGEVDSINFLDDSITPDLKMSVREYFRQYFQNNPVRANGKPKFYPFNISFKSDSNNISKAPTSGLSTSSPINQTKPVSEAQQALVRRLRSVNVSSQPSKESPKLSQTQGSGSSSIQQQVTQTQNVSAPQTNQEQQVSRQRVVVKQNTSTPQASQERQTSQQQVVVKQSASSLQTNQEEQTSQQRVVVRQTTSTPQTNQEQASQEEVSSTQSSVGSSKKLLQQLRQIRDQRQSSNQEK